MTQQGAFQLDCLHCKKPIVFSAFELDAENSIVACPQCSKKYGFDTNIKKQLKTFSDLCHQIQKSENILGNANVAVNVGSQEVKIPFKILLTRLKSTLDLQIGGEKVTICFRIQPTKL